MPPKNHHVDPCKSSRSAPISACRRRRSKFGCDGQDVAGAWFVPAVTLRLDTEELEKGSIKYDLRQDGTAIYVNSEDLYPARMALAREGLPAQKGIGFELFDKVDLGSTDFEQKIKVDFRFILLNRKFNL